MDAWLAGPVDAVAPSLQPVAHALLHARADVERALDGATAAELIARPGVGASAAYHLRHVAGSLDRLLTYARGVRLSDEQLAALEREELDAPRKLGNGDVRSVVTNDPAGLRAEVLAAIDAALAQVRATPEESLGEAREVGRKRLPSTVGGLLFHAAEHSARHAGQAVTAVLAVRRAPAARHTTRSVVFGALQRVLSLERGFLHTARGLAVAPGRVIRRYIAGHLDEYTNPIAYLLVAFAGFALIGELLDAGVRGAGSGDRYLTALVVPFVAVSSRLVFARARYNFAEHLILVTYLFGQTALVLAGVQLVLPVLFTVLDVPPLGVVAVLTGVCVIGYFAWAYGRFFERRRRLAALGGVVSLLAGVAVWGAALVGIVALARR